MNLEQQVTSLEPSRKLRELGVKQESLFVYDEGSERVIFTPDGERRPSDIAAFTVAELIELLGDKFGVLERFPHSGDFGAYIPNDIGTSATGAKVADVLAELLLKIENKLITV